MKPQHKGPAGCSLKDNGEGVGQAVIFLGLSSGVIPCSVCVYKTTDTNEDKACTVWNRNIETKEGKTQETKGNTTDNK